MDSCSHRGHTFYTRVGEGFERTCEACGVSGSGRTTEEAHVSFLLARMRAGERLSGREEAVVAWTPAPFGTAPSCHHADHARSFLLGST